MKKFFLTLVFSMGMALPAPAATVQVVLLGINAEKAGIEHPESISNYENIVGNMLALSHGSGLLVVGGGKNQQDDVTVFWRRIGTDLFLPITFVHGAEAIRNQSFSGFGVIVVVSSEAGTPSGGLTQAENDAFAERHADVEAFLNSGGAILGFSQRGLANPYHYVPLTLGEVSAHPRQESADITPTHDGAALGITDSLDVCCWQEEYDAFFFEVLATNAVTGNPVAVRYVGIIDQICDLFFPDAIVGTEGDDFLIGTPGDDIIIGLGGKDVLKGLGGNDVLCGGPEGDRLYGGKGGDLLYGGDGDDVLKGEGGDDDLLGEAGDDRLNGNSGDDYLYGGEGADRLMGDSGDDKIEGGDDDDILSGEAGDDLLNGGAGIDRLIGQKGWNSCMNGEVELGCQ